MHPNPASPSTERHGLMTTLLPTAVSITRGLAILWEVSLSRRQQAALGLHDQDVLL